MNVIILNRQNLLDLSLQAYGSAAALFEIAIDNGIGITDTLETGSILTITQSDYEDNDIVSFYKRKDIKPATLLPEVSTVIVPTGIGSMQIESTTNTFIVG